MNCLNGSRPQELSAMLDEIATCLAGEAQVLTDDESTRSQQWRCSWQVDLEH